MSKELVFVLIFFWVISASYVMYTHNKSYRLTLEIVIGAILLGPILALFVKEHERTIKKHYYIEESENDRHRKWFQTLDLINRNTIPDYGRTIPPPPPISRPRINQEEVRAEWRRQNGITKLKDFKFLRDNVKD